MNKMNSPLTAIDLLVELSLFCCLQEMASSPVVCLPGSPVLSRPREGWPSEAHTMCRVGQIKAGISGLTARGNG